MDIHIGIVVASVEKGEKSAVKPFEKENRDHVVVSHAPESVPLMTVKGNIWQKAIAENIT